MLKKGEKRENVLQTLHRETRDGPMMRSKRLGADRAKTLSQLGETKPKVKKEKKRTKGEHHGRNARYALDRKKSLGEKHACGTYTLREQKRCGFQFGNGGKGKPQLKSTAFPCCSTRESQRKRTEPHQVRRSGKRTSDFGTTKTVALLGLANIWQGHQRPFARAQPTSTKTMDKRRLIVMKGGGPTKYSVATN